MITNDSLTIARNVWNQLDRDEKVNLLASYNFVMASKNYIYYGNMCVKCDADLGEYLGILCKSCADKIDKKADGRGEGE